MLACWGKYDGRNFNPKLVCAGHHGIDEFILGCFSFSFAGELPGPASHFCRVIGTVDMKSIVCSTKGPATSLPLFYPDVSNWKGFD